jgi:hypothetical protein
MKNLITTLLFCFFAFSINAQSISSSESYAILSQIDELVNFGEDDFNGIYTFLREVPGQGQSAFRAEIFRRDREDKITVLIMDPVEDRGKGYLKIGNNLWLYDPESRRFNVTSARDRFQNSNFRVSDFSPSNLANDYGIISAEAQTLGAYNTTRYYLEATNDTVIVPEMMIWVDENGLIRLIEEYSLSGQLLRTIAIRSYQRLDNKFVPIQIYIIDALRGRNIDGQFINERTIISVQNASNEALGNLTFTQAYLERNSQQ